MAVLLSALCFRLQFHRLFAFLFTPDIQLHRRATNKQRMDAKLRRCSDSLKTAPGNRISLGVASASRRSGLWAMVLGLQGAISFASLVQPSFIHFDMPHVRCTTAISTYGTTGFAVYDRQDAIFTRTRRLALLYIHSVFVLWYRRIAAAHQNC